MSGQIIVALVASAIAAVVAITVPRWTFQRTVEHDRLKWLRDRRAELYVDMLTEGYAEHQWFTEQMARLEIAMIKAEDEEQRRPSSLDSMEPLPDVRLDVVAHDVVDTGATRAGRRLTSALR